VFSEPLPVNNDRGRPAGSRSRDGKREVLVPLSRKPEIRCDPYHVPRVGAVRRRRVQERPENRPSNASLP
jgi:hypothetical protein